MKEFYDLILIDTCSLSDVSKSKLDPVILAKYSDASVLFASEESLGRDTLVKLAKELKRHRISPFGMVVKSGETNEYV